MFGRWDIFDKCRGGHAGSGFFFIYTVLKAPLELEHHAISHFNLTLMIYHGVLVEIKKLFWFFHNFTLKLGTF